MIKRRLYLLNSYVAPLVSKNISSNGTRKFGLNENKEMLNKSVQPAVFDLLIADVQLPSKLSDFISWL